MALSPEDVLNRNFTATQFRRGYDEQEVDDFLDEIVVELRRLTAENEDLRTKLEECRQGLGGEIASGSAAAAGDAAGDSDPDLAAVQARIDQARQAEQEATKRADEAAARAEQAEQESGRRVEAANAAAEQAEQNARGRGEAAASGASAEPGPTEAAAPVSSQSAAPTDAAGVLVLAQRLHDEYVAAGQSTRDQLVGEAQQRHDELIAEATRRHDELIADAEQRSAELLEEAEERRRQVLEDLTRERSELDQQVARLREHEGSFRQHLKEYLEEQLEALSRPSVEPAERVG